MSNCDRTFINVNFNGQSDWLVAKDGYITGRGAMPPRILESYREDSTTKDGKIFTAQMELIERATSDKPLSKHKIATIGELQPGKVIDFAYDKNIKDTYIWKTTRSVGDIKAGECFKIVGAKDNFLLTRKIDSERMMFTGPTVETDPESLKQLEKAGLFKAADIVDGMCTVRRPFYKDCSELTKLPKSFDDFGLSAKAIEVVSKGIDRGINVTPFLTGKIHATDGMLDAMTNNLFEWQDLLGASLTDEQCDILVTAINLTLPVKSYLTDLDAIMKDSDAWEYLASMDNIKESDRRYVKTLYAYNTDFDAEDVFKSFYSFWLNRLGLNELLEDMSIYGMLIDGIISIPTHILRTATKRELAGYFMFDGLQMPDGGVWNDEFLMIINNSTSVYFDSDKGLLLESGGLKYARDCNSVVAYDKDGVSLWRAINVNEKIYTYGVAV